MTSEEKNIELEKRILFLEERVAILQHALEVKDIVKSTPYPPYYPWTTPNPVESMFSPSKWQRMVPHS